MADHLFPNLLNLLEDRPLLCELAAGVVTALVFYVWARRSLRQRGTLAPALGHFPIVQAGTPHRVVSMNALRGTPDGGCYVGGSEKRAAFRRCESRVAIFFTDAAGISTPQRAWVVDRSRTGLGIVARHAVSTGCLLRVRAAHAPPGTPWVTVEVRGGAQAGKRWRLGCRFVKTPEWRVLLLFG